MAFVALQGIAALFALFAWSRVLIRFKDHKIDIKGFFLWSILWVGCLVSVVLPQTSDFLASALGIGRPVDAIIYGSIIILSYLVFRLYIKLEATNFETTRLVRALAIEKAVREKRRNASRR